ncbi:MAG TPA: TldD/PmbA family protein [bacterium]|nr:TldD/PmbA family protein [bacterium]
MENLLTLCDRAVEAALKAGADEAEAMSVRIRDVNVELQKNDLQIARSMTGDGLGLRVFKNGSLGFSYVNSFDDESMAESVDRAVGIATAAPRDEFNVLPEPTPLEPLEGILDEAAEEFGVETAVESALTLLRTARDFDPRVTVDSGELAGHWGEKAIATSRGVRASERSSLYYCYIFGMAKEGETVSSFDFQFDGARSAAAIDPASVAHKFAENVVGSLGAVKGESFNGPIILAPKAASEILVDPITSSVRASSVQRETSKFRGRLGQVVASDLLNVTDDSTLKDGAATSAFDREGLRPEVLPLIQGGVLKHFLYDAYTARKDDRSSNGHAGGGASSVPLVSTTNVVVASGETSLADMIAGIDKGILATRFSGNADPVSGDFSGSVKGGRMIRGGKLAEPLCGTMIAGNTFELLKRITAVSSEHERMFGSVVPYIALEEISVTGG